jgi:hypothetical protein
MPPKASAALSTENSFAKLFLQYLRTAKLDSVILLCTKDMINAQSMSHQRIPPTSVRVLLDFQEIRLLRHQVQRMPDRKRRTQKPSRPMPEIPDVVLDGEVVLKRLLSVQSDQDASQFCKEMFFAQWAERENEKIGAVRRLRQWTQYIATIPYSKWQPLVEAAGSDRWWGVDNILKPLKVEVRWNDRPPCLELRTYDVVTAISGVLQLKELRGQRFRLCARQDCGQIYEITSNHDRSYCTPECAHLIAVRRSRNRSLRKQKKG